MTRIWTTLVLVLVACGDNLGTANEQAGTGGQAKQGEAWSQNDNPSMFASDLEYRLSALPLSGEAQTIPWAGSYYPVFEDSINAKWAGPNSDSTPMKYQKAFGGTNVEDLVSRYHGIDSFTSQKECADSTVCDSTMGESCAKRPGAAKGRCIPGWWGICHAWSPAAILLPEPKFPVVRNGVTFEVADIKALETLVHNSTTSRFVSLRCNSQNQAVDANGRVVANECRDTNAATYHLLLTNYLGIRRQAFVEDRIAGYEVWNQPLRGFNITEQRAVTLAEANALVGVAPVGGTTVNKTGTVAQNVWAHQGSFAVTPGSQVKVAMSGTNDADLYVRFGSQPDAAAFDCRPYQGTSTETCDLTVPAGQTQLFVSVLGYSPTSDFSLAITTGGQLPTTWQFNAAAKSFVSVKLSVKYISEASASAGNTASTINSYTQTDSYQYVLELDAAGKIIGGEWVGASKTAHPDFLWLPTGVATQTVAGGAISYATVKALVMDSQRDPSTPVTDGGVAPTTRTATDTTTLPKNAWKVYGPFDVTAGTSFVASMTGTGDADLYVKKGMAPTATSYDCRPYQGTSVESCTVTGGGLMFIAVNGYADSSTYSLTVTWQGGVAPAMNGGVVLPADAGVVVTPDAGVVVVPDAGMVVVPDAGVVVPDAGTVSTDGGVAFQHLNLSGTVAQGQWQFYTLMVPTGRSVVVRTTSATDVDLYLQLNQAPTLNVFAARAYTISGNETLAYSVSPNTQLNIGVYGYAASSFTLTTADQ